MNWRSRGEFLDFKYHKYLKQIYQDQEGTGNGIIVYQKSAQTGLTERMITEALWLPDQYPYNSIYFFPTTGTLGDLVSERIDRPINESQYLMEVSGRAKVMMGKHADKLGLKRMTNGFVYFRGSNALPAITSVAGDAIFVDEVDRMDMDNVPYFSKRLEHSDLRWQRWGSTPTFPDFGINKKFRETDQTYYHIKCPYCNYEQVLDYWRNVDEERGIIVCAKCRKKIIPYTIEGRWVAKYPDRDIRGYHISQLYSPKLSIKDLIKSANGISDSELQQFYNQNLGVPYEPKGMKITDADINACKKDYVIPDYSQEGVFIGVDVGKICHYIIRTKDRIVAIGDVSNFFGVDSLEELMSNFKVRGMVIDALPETRQVQELIKKFPNKIKMCYYTGLAEMKEAKRYWKVDGPKVNTDRTVSLDFTFAEIYKKQIELPKNLDSYSDFRSHIKSTTRRITEDNKGNKRAEYVETGEDHLLHAMNYGKLAVNIYNTATPEIFIL